VDVDSLDEGDKAEAMENLTESMEVPVEENKLDIEAAKGRNSSLWISWLGDEVKMNSGLSLNIWLLIMEIKRLNNSINCV